MPGVGHLTAALGLQGPILGFIYAVKELLEEGKASKGSLPVNVAFVFEGEEENGSVGFEEAIQGNQHWFEGTQLIVISNTLWVGERVPCLTYGAPTWHLTHRFLS